MSLALAAVDSSACGSVSSSLQCSTICTRSRMPCFLPHARALVRVSGYWSGSGSNFGLGFGVGLGARG
jgi:hypothetical protein